MWFSGPLSSEGMEPTHGREFLAGPVEVPFNGKESAPMDAKSRPATTANDALKRGNASRFWSGMIVAILLHIGMFTLWPELTAADFSYAAEELEFIELPPEIEIPPPPEALARPATPVIASTEISEEITMAVSTWDANPVETLPPPPTEAAATGDFAADPVFTPYTVRPDIRNRREVERAMEREYPPPSQRRRHRRNDAGLVLHRRRRGPSADPGPHHVGASLPG